MHCRAGLGGDELVGLEVDAEALGIERVHEGGAGEVAGDAAVARRHLAHILGPDDAAGAVHVLDHDVRRAIDMAGEMLGEHAALDVGRATGSEVDQDGEALVLVEGIVGVGRGSAGDDDQRGKEQAARERVYRRDCFKTVPRTRCAPSPLVGEGWGGGS